MGKDALFGQERSLFKLHDQLLDMAGPLTCLWADMANKEAKVNPQEVILLVQRVLVFLGSAAYSVKQERMKVAWLKINPSTLSLLQEDSEEDKEENTLFGSGFLERAAKWMEEEKALAKVTGTRPRGNPQKRQGDPNDLGVFGVGRPCKVRWQELSAPSAVPQNTASAEDIQRQEQESIVDSEVKQTKTLETVCMQNQDASLQGWGAVCMDVRTGGLWSQTEWDHHINCLELLAAMLALKTFTKSRENVHVHLHMDNKTAVFLCKPHGRDPVPNNEQTGNPVLAVVFDKECVPVNRVSTRPRQLHSR